LFLGIIKTVSRRCSVSCFHSPRGDSQSIAALPAQAAMMTSAACSLAYVSRQTKAGYVNS
jgi:hypothetical protein